MRTSPTLVESHFFGSTRVDAILDGHSWMPLDEIFAAETAQNRARLQQASPEDFQNGKWKFSVRVFLIRTRHTTVLFDAGVGPAETKLARAFGRPGQLPAALEVLKVSPDDIEHIVVSHHHDDHVGWLTGRPTGTDLMQNARVWIDSTEVALASNPYYRDSVFAGLLESELTRTVSGIVSISPGLDILPAQGHTAGHLTMMLTTGDNPVVFTGDLLHFSHQLCGDHESGPFDTDPGAAQSTRRMVLEAHPIQWLASAHLPDAFTRIGDQMI